jgi:hydroxyacylglutathione hydrolase
VEPRVVGAGNRGPFTLDGTRTFLVGGERVAVIDPGPEVEDHLRALVLSLQAAREVRILLTHGHGDHAAGAASLAVRLSAPILAPPSCGTDSSGVAVGSSVGGGYEGAPLREGDRIPTDEGELVVLEVPGHTRDHLAFHWPEAGAVFVGDLLLGQGNTTWIGEYPGCVADYLASLKKVRSLGPRTLYPTHGPRITDPVFTLDSFEKHRLERIEEVREASRAHPQASPGELAEIIHGGVLPPRVAKAAAMSVEVMLHHLRESEDSQGRLGP